MTDGLDELIDHLSQRIGLDLSGTHQNWVAKRLTQLGLTEANPRAVLDGHHWGQIAHEINIHETSFMRSHDSIRKALQAIGSDWDEIGILSAGCSYGQEAYSALLIARTLYPELSIRVKGIDISPTCIDKAQSGKYSSKDINEQLGFYLRSGDIKLDGDSSCFSDALRALCCFEVRNVLDLHRYERKWDYQVIICQNCLTYYDIDSRLAVANSLVSLLPVGGVLVVAGAELVGARLERAVPLYTNWPQILVKEF